MVPPSIDYEMKNSRNTQNSHLPNNSDRAGPLTGAHRDPVISLEVK